MFDFTHLYNSIWLVMVTMTTVGYGDIYPQTHFGRFFGVIACIIGMLLVSYLVVGMSSLLDLSPQEQKAYAKIKKLTTKDNVAEKIINVIKMRFKYRKAHQKRQWHIKFVYYLLYKQHVAIFKNVNGIAHSRL